MKVLHVISDRNVGGAGILLLHLLRCFPEEGIENVVALPEEALLIERIQALRVRVIELRYPCEGCWLRSVKELRGVLRRERPDVVHANAALSARIAAKSMGIAVVHTRHCCYPPSGILRFAPFRMFGGICNRALSDLSIATAEVAADNLAALGIPRDRIRTIPNGSFPVREVSKAELTSVREHWQLSEADVCIGICARLETCKGHETFLRAAAMLIERFPSMRLRFLIAGEGSQRASLERLSDALGIANSVRFLGFLQDTAPFYRLLSVNVNCSVGTETSCLAISEGMSASLPTVASDYGGNVAMLADTRVGRLFSAGDPASLADVLGDLLSSRTTLLAMGNAAKECYEQKYTARRMATSTAAVYREVLNSKKTGCNRKIQHQRERIYDGRDEGIRHNGGVKSDALGTDGEKCTDGFGKNYGEKHRK